MGILIRMAITALGLWLASHLVSGVAIDNPLTFVYAALLLGVVNAVVRPIAFILTLPITLLSLGLLVRRREAISTNSSATKRPLRSRATKYPSAVSCW